MSADTVASPAAPAETAGVPTASFAQVQPPKVTSPYPANGPRPQSTSKRWIDRWLAACSELAELERSNPMTDAVIDEIDGRMIRIGDRWLADFASCN